MTSEAKEIGQTETKLSLLWKKWSGIVKSYSNYHEVKANGGVAVFIKEIQAMADEIERSEMRVSQLIQAEEARQKREEEEYERQQKLRERASKIKGKRG